MCILAVDRDGDGFINTISDPYYKASGLDPNLRAPALSWFREDRVHTYFMHPNQKGAHPDTSSKLALSMHEVMRNASAKGIVLKTLRYHTYLAHCYFLNRVGSFDDLPLPLITTSRLDENTGFYSSDVWPKTCSIVKI
jgi:hypothetical protein